MPRERKEAAAIPVDRHDVDPEVLKKERAIKKLAFDKAKRAKPGSADAKFTGDKRAAKLAEYQKMQKKTSL